MKSYKDYMGKVRPSEELIRETRGKMLTRTAKKTPFVWKIVPVTAAFAVIVGAAIAAGGYLGKAGSPAETAGYSETETQYTTNSATRNTAQKTIAVYNDLDGKERFEFPVNTARFIWDEGAIYREGVPVLTGTGIVGGYYGYIREFYVTDITGDGAEDICSLVWTANGCDFGAAQVYDAVNGEYYTVNGTVDYITVIDDCLVIHRPDVDGYMSVKLTMSDLEKMKLGTPHIIDAENAWFEAKRFKLSQAPVPGSSDDYNSTVMLKFKIPDNALMEYDRWSFAENIINNIKIDAYRNDENFGEFGLYNRIYEIITGEPQYDEGWPEPQITKNGYKFYDFSEFRDYTYAVIAGDDVVIVSFDGAEPTANPEDAGIVYDYVVDGIYIEKHA